MTIAGIARIRSIGSFLGLVVAWGIFPAAGWAGMVESQESASPSSQGEWRENELKRLSALCDHELVQLQLERFGLTSQEAKARMAKLSDSELRAMARRIDQVQAGGQDEYQERPLYKRFGFWILWALVIVLVIVFFIGVGRNIA